MPGGKMASIRGKGWRSGRTGKRTTFPRPGCDRGPTGPVPLARRRPVPGPAGRGARLGRVGLWPGALRPRLAMGQRSAVAGAMAPARESGHRGMHRNASSGGNRKRDPRFPRPCGTVPCRPVGPGDTEVSARPGGDEAPAGGGRALAGGFGPRLGKGQRGAVAKAMAFARVTGHPRERLSGRDQETRPAFPLPVRNAAL